MFVLRESLFPFFFLFSRTCPNNLTLSTFEFCSWSVLARTNFWYCLRRFFNNLIALSIEWIASSKAKIHLWIVFSSYQNWAICYTWRHPKCTWSSKDSLRKDYETSFTEDSKEWSQHWWYNNNGWFHCGWNLVREQTSRWLHPRVTLFAVLHDVFHELDYAILTDVDEFESGVVLC